MREANHVWSSIWEMLSLKCLRDIQVKRARGKYIVKAGAQGIGKREIVNLDCQPFNTMGMDEIHWAKHRKGTE